MKNVSAFLTEEQRDDVGYTYVIRQLETKSPLGAEKIKNIQPFDNVSHLQSELDNLEIVVNALRYNKEYFENICDVLGKVKDIRNTLKKIGNGQILDEVELFEIKNLTFIIEGIFSIYEKININIDEVEFEKLDKLKQLLDVENSGLPTFYIYNSYSKDLKQLRLDKQGLEQEIIFLNSENGSIEKLELLKKERLGVLILIDEEENNTKEYLTKEIKKYLAQIQQNVESISRLDFLMAKATLAIKINATKPILIENKKLNFKNIWNLMIDDELKAQNKSMTPISIELNNGVTTITGANMGGKTVSIKTIVLNLLLGQSGFFVLAESFEFELLDFIFYSSDDRQSTSKGLSSFSSEIINLKQIFKFIKEKKGFLALDEFARTTNPKEGSILVKSLIETLNNYSSFTLVSTHYDNVFDAKINHYEVVGLKNINMADCSSRSDEYCINFIQENMDYRLFKVEEKNEVPKDALNICALLGLDKEMLNIAEKYYLEGK